MSLAFPRRLKQRKFEKPLLLYILFNMAVQIAIKVYYQPYYIKFNFFEASFLS